MATTHPQQAQAELPRTDTASSTAGPVLDGPCRQVPSTALLQGGKAVEINHNGAIYRLQSTKLGKLILTK
ncbi:MAG: hemin uptake protein HemP [Ramlibacter sp.]|jgi:hemin uptake protein HemP|nr:hemin uptake protein HemP [Ramlibacter sp.]